MKYYHLIIIVCLFLFIAMLTLFIFYITTVIEFIIGFTILGLFLVFTSNYLKEDLQIKENKINIKLLEFDIKRKNYLNKSVLIKLQKQNHPWDKYASILINRSRIKHKELSEKSLNLSC